MINRTREWIISNDCDKIMADYDEIHWGANYVGKNILWDFYEKFTKIFY